MPGSMLGITPGGFLGARNRTNVKHVLQTLSNLPGPCLLISLLWFPSGIQEAWRYLLFLANQAAG